MKLRILAAALVLLSGACASESPPAEDPVAVETPDPEDSGRDEAKRDRKKGRTPGGQSPGGPSAGGASAEDGDASEDRNEGSSTNGGSGSDRSAPYPAAGTYTFSQSGYEEFCDSAGNCDKQPLPKRQPSEVSYERRDGDAAVVVTKQEQSRSRTTTTWARFDASGVHVTKVHVEFNYSGFPFNRTYEPQPPVEAIRFPLTEGEKWSGKWKDETSGSYSVRVGNRRTIYIGGRRIAVFPLETTTEFRGDFEGKSRITVYVDPDTKAIVATDGVLNVTSRFGRYATVFETKLSDGPEY